MTKDEGLSPPPERILEAALEVLSEHKISGTRMRQIARQAEMSQGNLHYYFPSKDALFLNLLDHLLERFVQERKDTLSDANIRPILKLSFILNQDRDIILRRKELDVFFDFWVQGTRDPAIREKITSLYARWRHDISLVIDEGVRTGLFNPRHAPLIPALLVSVMDGAALQYLIDPNAFDLDAYFTTAYEMILQLLLSPNETRTTG